MTDAYFRVFDLEPDTDPDEVQGCMNLAIERERRERVSSDLGAWQVLRDGHGVLVVLQFRWAEGLEFRRLEGE